MDCAAILFASKKFGSEMLQECSAREKSESLSIRTFKEEYLLMDERENGVVEFGNSGM